MTDKPPCTFCGRPSRRSGTTAGTVNVVVHACRDDACVRQFRLAVGGHLAANHGGAKSTKRRTRQDSKRS